MQSEETDYRGLTSDQTWCLGLAVRRINKLVSSLANANESMIGWLASINGPTLNRDVKQRFDIFAEQIFPTSPGSDPNETTIAELAGALVYHLSTLLRSDKVYGVWSKKQAVAGTALQEVNRGRISEAAANDLSRSYAEAVAHDLISLEEATSVMDSTINAIQGDKLAAITAGMLTMEMRDLIKMRIEKAQTASASLQKELTALPTSKQTKTTAACLQAMRSPYLDLLAFHVTMRAFGEDASTQIQKAREYALVNSATAKEE